MLRRTVFIATLAAFAAVLATMTAPALAEIHVPFRLDQIKMNYTIADGKMIVVPDTNAGFYVRTLDTLGGPGAPELGLEKISKYGVDEFDFLLDLTLVSKGVNLWAASGVMMASSKVDENGDPAASHIVMLADFNATKFVFNDAEINAAPMGLVEKEFRVVGALSPYTGSDFVPSGAPSVLIGGDPWEFSGYNAITDDFETLSVSNRDAYSSGQLTTIHFSINVAEGVDTMDELLAVDRSSPQGDAFGMLIPAPTAVILGLLGLSVVGIRMRRHA